MIQHQLVNLCNQEDYVLSLIMSSMFVIHKLALSNYFLQWENVASILKPLATCTMHFPSIARVERYSVKNLDHASQLVLSCKQYFKENEAEIRASTGKTGALFVPGGSTSAKTINAIGLLEMGSLQIKISTTTV